MVAHLQVGLVLQSLGASLNAESERAGIYLTNALTGWEPRVDKPPVLYPELEQERDKADQIKRDVPILVILGNPPYNGYAGMAVEEERALTTAYRTTKRVRRPEGQGLNDLYVRFFRMTERRIEKAGQGIVSFISNYSWLDGRSFTGMRERYLEVFDMIRIDSLNGDKYRTGKRTPDGLPDPSIFSTEQNREGIQVGTAIAMLVRKKEHESASNIRVRQVWGAGKWQKLAASAEAELINLYNIATPEINLGLAFAASVKARDYFHWPTLPELIPTYFSGVQTKRDQFLIDIDRDNLLVRLAAYFDKELHFDEFSERYIEVFQLTARYAPRLTREYLVHRGFIRENVVRYCYRTFDVRWIYWEPETKLLGEKSPNFFPNVNENNLWIEAREKQTEEHFSRGTVTSVLSDNFGNGFSTFFPLLLIGENYEVAERFNVTKLLQDFLASHALPIEAIFFSCHRCYAFASLSR